MFGKWHGRGKRENVGGESGESYRTNKNMESKWRRKYPRLVREQGGDEVRRESGTWMMWGLTGGKDREKTRLWWAGGGLQWEVGR